MTVLVGYVPHKGGRGSLDLGLQLAHAVGTSLSVVTVVPRQWSTPSLARVDAEYAEFAQQLLTQHPREAAAAFVPLVTLLEGLLEEASEAGAIRSGLDHRRITGVVLQAVMFNAFADTISVLACSVSIRKLPMSALRWRRAPTRPSSLRR